MGEHDVATFTPLDELAALAAGDAGQASRARLALHAADGVLALQAGERTPEGRALGAFLARTEPTPLGAAARNAAVMRHTEIDDIHRPTMVTATAIALPAALGMAAQRGSGDALLDAVHAGHEVSVRMAFALGGARLLEKGLWPSYLVAPVGAAAAAGRALGLDASRMRHALALALSQTPRLIGKTAGDRPGRWLLFGNMVRAGCVAALAAADGIDGDVGLLNAAWLQSMGAPAGHAAPSGAVTEQFSIKPHCSAKQVLAAVHGMRQLIGQGLDPAAIETIELAVPTAYAAMIDREPPQTSRLASMVSARWQLALAALRPALLDDVARDRFPDDPALAAFAAKVSIRADAGLDARFPRCFPARLSISAAGRRHELLVEDSAGDPVEGLRYDAARLLDKARRILGQGDATDLVAQTLRLAEDPTRAQALIKRFTLTPTAP